jgi:integrase
MTPQSSSPTSIRTSTTATTKNTGQPPAADKLEKIISKCKARGLTTLVDYLANKARKSRRTAVSFWFGLEHLNRFIEQSYKGYNIETVLPTLKTQAKVKNKIDVYKLLDGFISYLQNDSRNGHNLTPKSIHNYMTAARSYFQYNDIDISPSKFKYRISLPPLYREDEEAIDSNDIKEILHHCDNRRLKAYLLVLASGGMRAIEALGIRECDIDFSGINFAVPNDTANPAGIRIRKEFAKTRTERHIFISNEAARFLHNWIEWKYRDRHLENKRLVNRVRSKDDLVFSRIIYTSKYPMGLYTKMLVEFQKVLKLAGFNGRKEDGVYKRRKITFHSFRRFVKTTIANQTRNSDYSEWFLGHKKNTYYVNKPDELRRIYKDECMKYLTFLDYPTLEATGKNIEAKLSEKEKEIQLLRQRDSMNADAISSLSDRMQELMVKIQELEKKRQHT